MLTTGLVPPPDSQSANSTAADHACRLCGARLHRTLLDLGDVPLANRTIAAAQPDPPTYRLHARICDACTLVQIADVASPETLATPVPHQPVLSATCHAQTRRHADALRKRLHLDQESVVIELGRGDGTMFGHFQAAGIPVRCVPLGAVATPAAGPAPDRISVFNTETAMELAVRDGCADLVIANDVLPYAPNLFDFAAGLASILRQNGVLTLQVPHLLSIVQKLQFDAFRHDCYNYLSLRVIEHVLRSVGLRVFDAERLPDHGGSLRVLACRAVGPHPPRPGLRAVRLAESFSDDEYRDFYDGFSDRVAALRTEIRDFLHNRGAAGRRVVAYGAATRGITLMHACGITQADVTCVADPYPGRQGRLLPGSRIPVVAPEILLPDPPDDLIILPWPNAANIARKLQTLRQYGTSLWTVMPRITRL